MVRRRNARIRASELRFLNSQRNVICNVMYKRVILGRWRKAVRDVLYRGHVAAICLQRFARGRRGRRDTIDVRMEKNILLWDQAKSSLQSHAIDKCSLKKIENEHNTMNREEKYAALQEYAGTLNISYSSFEGKAPKGRKLEDDTEGCLRNVSSCDIKYGALNYVSNLFWYYIVCASAANGGVELRFAEHLGRPACYGGVCVVQSYPSCAFG